MTTKILLMLGGVHHDFAGFAGAFGEMTGGDGVTITASYDGDALLGLDESGVNVVALYTCLGGAQKDGVVAEDFTPEQTAGLRRSVEAGGGLLALHAATVLRESNSAMRGLIGGRFLSHPPRFDFTVSPLARRHPITDGVGAFGVHDEFYMQAVDDGIAIHMTAEDRGVVHPMVWTKPAGAGRVVYIAPGHTASTWANPSFRRLLRQSVAWLADEPL